MGLHRGARSSPSTPVKADLPQEQRHAGAYHRRTKLTLEHLSPVAAAVNVPAALPAGRLVEDKIT